MKNLNTEIQQRFEEGTEEFNKYYGVYAGFVEDNQDPENLWRIKAKVPEIFGNSVSDWALPRGIYNGKGYGFFAIPEKGDNIWLSFLNGDARFPLWEYGAVAKNELPQNAGQKAITLIDKNGFLLQINEKGFKIGNQSYDLRQLFQDLIDWLKESQIITPAGLGKFTADSLAEIEKIQVSIQDILTSNIDKTRSVQEASAQSSEENNILNEAELSHEALESIEAGYPVFDLLGNTWNLGNTILPIKILNLSLKPFREVKGVGGISLKREQFLDRCHWVYGECGGVPEASYYANAIENLIDAESINTPGVTSFNDEESLKNAVWQAGPSHSYIAGTIKTINEPYREFNTARTDKELLNKSAYIKRAIREVIMANFGWSEDKTNGSWLWAGSENAIINHFQLESPSFEPYNFVTIQFMKNGIKFSQTFYKFRPKN